MVISLLRMTLLQVTLLSFSISQCRAQEASANKVQKTISTNSSTTTKVESPEKTNSDSVQNSAANWLSHAMNSYEQWQHGNIYSAITEGEESVKLNPDNPVTLINLALMKQRTSSYDEASNLYWQAAKLLPDSWVPPLGIARCYILSKDETSSHDILQMMSEQKLRDFNWYFGTAKTWLEIKNYEMAESTAKRAVEAASKPDQKAAAENLQFLALLRAGNVEKAHLLKESVFKNNSPRDPELYVRTAAILLPPSNPKEGSKLLDCAIANLNGPTDGEVFLKLGTLFQDKAEDAKTDKENRMAWLKSAQTAYEKSTLLSPKSADYHFALASALSSEGDSAKASEELNRSISIDRSDILGPYLISKISETAPVSGQSTPITLSLVKFKITGLTCSCHLAKVHGVLRRIKGVVFISTPPQKPFAGLLLVDRSFTTPEQLITQCNDNAIAPEKDQSGNPIKVELELVSQDPVDTVSKALSIARDVRFGPAVAFDETYSDYLNRFQEVKPIKPVTFDRTTAQADLNWVEPL